jgi:hypothetical protein
VQLQFLGQPVCLSLQLPHRWLSVAQKKLKKLKSPVSVLSVDVGHRTILGLFLLDGNLIMRTRCIVACGRHYILQKTVETLAPAVRLPVWCTEGAVSASRQLRGDRTRMCRSHSVTACMYHNQLYVFQLPFLEGLAMRGGDEVSA